MNDISLFFSALADPTRLRLLNLMRNGEICVCFLQGVLNTNQPKISRHLAYLRKAGLVEARKEGKWVHYALTQQEPELQEALMLALKRVAKESMAGRDLKRLEAIRCCPSRYGLSTPSTESE